jgi:hypothetical protein
MTEELHSRTLTTAGIVVAALTAGVLMITVVAGFVEISAGLDFLVAPAALLGLISPVVAYRLYLRIRDRLPAAAGAEHRCQKFLMATIVAAAITESVAVFGVIAFMLSGAFAGLIGVVTHVILVGAIWPTREKLAIFLPNFP